MKCVAPSFYLDVSGHMFCLIRFSLKPPLNCLHVLRSSQIALESRRRADWKAEDSTVLACAGKPVDLVNVESSEDLATAFSSNYAEASSVLLDLATKCINKEENRDEVVTISSLRAAVEGFELSSGLGQRFTRKYSVRRLHWRGCTESGFPRSLGQETIR